MTRVNNSAPDPACLRAFYDTGNPPAVTEPRALPAPARKLRLISPACPGSPIRITGLDAPATITLLDVSGRTVARLAIAASQPALCPALPADTYACRITTSGRTFTQPIIVVAPTH